MEPARENNETTEESPSGIFQAPWESKKHWLCRRKFIEDHKEAHGIKRAVSLSMVWANINFLGCQYSVNVQEKVMYYPVPEDNEIERWLLVHPDIDSAEKPVVLGKRNVSSSGVEDETVDHHTKSSKLNNEESSDLIPFEDLTHQLDSFITMIRKDKSSESSVTPKNSNQSNNNQAALSRYEILQLLAKTCSCQSCFLHNNLMISRLAFLVQKSRLSSLLFDYNEATQSLALFINNQLMGTWKGSSKKELKINASTDIISEVTSIQEDKRPFCPSSRQVLVKTNELFKSSTPITADNKGHQLLLKMGWNKDDERVTPIVTTVNNGRVGLGGCKPSSLSSDDIRLRLTQFVTNEHETRLKFPKGLSLQDRKLIHTLSGQYNLLHKSYGKDNERYLVVTKKF